jgi:hypothetical protein
MAGLEPATSCLEDRHSRSAELHPDKFSIASDLETGYRSRFQGIHTMPESDRATKNWSGEI